MHLPARALPILIQTIATLLALVVLAVWPAASGPMLIVALPGASDADLVDATLAGGGTVLGAGPIAGSIVVSGDRARIARRAGLVLILAAPIAGCGLRVGTES